MKRLTILGATGSIGFSTADVVQRHADKFCVHALVGHSNVEKMLQLVDCLQPAWVIMTDTRAAELIRERLPSGIRFSVGMDAAAAAAGAEEVDIVMAAMVGSAGLPAALAAVRAGKHVALANKECLVAAGRIFMQQAREHGACVMPVDSEHAAVHQALRGHDRGSVRRIVLTASGGPFRDCDPQSLADVSPEQAVAHPNWDMGAKISIDSATMVNKALELIEARWLFDMPPEKLSAMIHPESIVHAMVEYCDGSVLAQMAVPDMRMPIAYALQLEPRLETGIDWLDLTRVGQLNFSAVDERRFPAMRLVRHVLAGDDSLAIAFNAANEVANEAFRNRQIGFMEIVTTIETVLGKMDNVSAHDLDTVWSLDREARRIAREVLGLA